ncbi:MAG TPA: flagellar hook capping FlgD N-terminal domain-containing protein, partial [Caulobacteraceae bacterium]
MPTSLDGYRANAQPSGVRVAENGAATGAGARIESGAARLAENFETFLTLLTAQLKNQDPLSPLDGNQFTQQLVQMSSVEQQLLSNDLLKTLVANTSGRTGGFGDPVDMIGKIVTAESGEAALTPDGATWMYELPKGATKATLEVKNAIGQVVWSGPAPALTNGVRHDFTWNGQKSEGGAAAEGVYTLSVKAEDGEGRAMIGKSFVEGLVTGVELFNGSA